MKPPPIIRGVDITPVSFKLKTPFVTAAGRKTRTDNVQITLRLSDGTRGLAEASSSLAMRTESQENMTRVLKEMVPELRGKPIDDYRALVALAWRLQPFHPTAAAAMECAILDAYTRTRGQSLADFFGQKAHTVESDLTLSVASPDALFKAARAALKQGFRKLKVKLAGGDPKTDFKRLAAVHRAAPKAALVADGNQGFTVSQALELTHDLTKAGISLLFFEQPFRKHDFHSMRLFRLRSRVPLFADESVHSAADALRLFESNAADGVNIKVAKSGLLGALDIIRMAQRFKKRLAIGCMEESKLGLAASVHLACGTGAFEWVDLDSAFLLEPTRVKGGFLTKGPKLSVKGIRSGIGI
jgi:L-alanine-DL-glutamate epimerase-like enolase superfamily enzyme